MGGLDVEGLLNFGVRGGQKMGNHHNHKEQVEENVCSECQGQYGVDLTISCVQNSPMAFIICLWQVTTLGKKGVEGIVKETR